jgi:hypothetical protein
LSYTGSVQCRHAWARQDVPCANGDAAEEVDLLDIHPGVGDPWGHWKEEVGMLDQLRHQLGEYLQQHQVGVLCTGDGTAIRAMPVTYHSRELALLCFVPSWSDVAYCLQAQAEVQLIIPANTSGTCWLCYQGEARTVTPGESSVLAGVQLSAPPEYYLLVEVQPRRLDLMDGRRGWGARETLEL